VRRHGTEWDVGQSRTSPDKSAFVPTDEAAARPDRHGHMPLGMSECPNRRGSLSMPAAGGDHGAPTPRSETKTDRGFRRYGR
jgi:hypothetical protein